MKNPIEQLLDENNDENIVLYFDEGPMEFEQIALIELDTGLYTLLHPVELSEDVDEDTAIVFQIFEDRGTLEAVQDEDVVDAVFDAYYILVDEAWDDGEE